MLGFGGRCRGGFSLGGGLVLNSAQAAGRTPTPDTGFYLISPLESECVCVCGKGAGFLLCAATNKDKSLRFVFADKQV